MTSLLLACEKGWPPCRQRLESSARRGKMPGSRLVAVLREARAVMKQTATATWEWTLELDNGVSTALVVPRGASVADIAPPPWALLLVAFSNGTNAMVSAIGNEIVNIQSRVTGLEAAHAQVASGIVNLSEQVSAAEARPAAVASGSEQDWSALDWVA